MNKNFKGTFSDFEMDYTFIDVFVLLSRPQRILKFHRKIMSKIKQYVLGNLG